MGRTLRVAALGLVIAAALSGVLGGARQAAAANGYEQWTAGYSDGCGYYWDGYAYTLRACPRADGGYDFYVGEYGQWVYFFSAGWTGDGGIWIYYQGWYYIMAPSYGSGSADPYGLYPTSTTIGKPTWDALTSNVLVNQILLDSNNRMIDTILSPNCIEIVGNVCYY